MKTRLHLMLFSLVLSMAVPPGAWAADDYESIFDGKSLTGWKALNMSYWSVRDGAITGESTPDNPCTSNQFIVWKLGGPIPQ